jgi:rhamnosyl/mannosyltransferase
VLKVLHLGKFYPPVPGGIERVVQALCTITNPRLDNHVLAFNTGSETVEEVVGGVRVTRVGTWGSAGSVSIAPAYFAHLRRAQADVMILASTATRDLVSQRSRQAAPAVRVVLRACGPAGVSRRPPLPRIVAGAGRARRVAPTLPRQSAGHSVRDRRRTMAAFGSHPGARRGHSS